MGFRRLDERIVHQGHVFDVAVARFEAPDGSTFERDVVRHPGAVGVVAVDDRGRAVLVRQYRPVADTELLEIPAGVCDVDGEDPEATARRELAEEVGLRAERWRLLTRYHVAVGMSDEVFWCYLAEGLTEGEQSLQGPEEEAMTVEWLALDEAPSRIADGTIADAKTIIGLLLARDALAEPG